MAETADNGVPSSVAPTCNVHFRRIRDGGDAGRPPPPPRPPIDFEGRNLPQQTIYHWKGNLLNGSIHFRYQQNILISRLYTHICRIKGCGGAGWSPPPIIFERLKLPQQIIYRRKDNLSESPNHQKYWESILVSRFYEQFWRNRRNLGHFRKFEKISNS